MRLLPAVVARSRQRNRLKRPQSSMTRGEHRRHHRERRRHPDFGLCFIGRCGGRPRASQAIAPRLQARCAAGLTRGRDAPNSAAENADIRHRRTRSLCPCPVRCHKRAGCAGEERQLQVSPAGLPVLREQEPVPRDGLTALVGRLPAGFRLARASLQPVRQRRASGVASWVEPSLG